MSDYWEWDGRTHLDDAGFFDFFTPERWNAESSVDIEGFCDCFHLVGCCSLAFNGEKVRAGDRIYYRDGQFELVRGESEPFICPVHKVEHTGTGFSICMTTGEHS